MINLIRVILPFEIFCFETGADVSAISPDVWVFYDCIYERKESAIRQFFDSENKVRYF